MTTRVIDDYTACAIAEDFADFKPSERDIIAAWSHLIKTGLCWRLQGWYGRSAQAMIDNEVFDNKGNYILKGNK